MQADRNVSQVKNSPGLPRPRNYSSAVDKIADRHLAAGWRASEHRTRLETCARHTRDAVRHVYFRAGTRGTRHSRNPVDSELREIRTFPERARPPSARAGNRSLSLSFGPHASCVIKITT